MNSSNRAAGSQIHPGQWRLDRLEVLNWGTFQGHHRVDVARRGFLLTGHSGSGKSSLVDAISAVLTPRMQLRFNAAAQDTAARGEDRSLVSYLRGAWRRSANEETGEVSSDYLRTGATFSGILLRYTNGTGGKPVVLVKLYHLRRGSNTPAEVSELSLLLQEEVALTNFVDYLRNGLETRRIKADWPDASVTDQHSRFSARFCRLLGIQGENAVLLLHKTQSAKSLGNLDELFRSFMLDKPKTFALAENAVAQFGELSEAHRLVVEARAQVELLRRLEEPSRIFEDSSAAAAAAERLAQALPVFKNAWKLKLAEHERGEAETAVRAADHEVLQATKLVDELETAHSLARQQADQRGGQELKLQQDRLDLAVEQERDVRARRAEAAGRLEAVGVTFPETFAEFEELRATARTERAALDAAQQQGKATLLELHEEFAAAKGSVRELEKELASLRRRRSNLPDRLVAARQHVAATAGLPATAFPFAGELLQVRSEFADWTGAVERVLRPLATVMLVPEAHIAAVREAVDGLFLGARLVFESVPTHPGPVRTVHSANSLVHRVEVQQGPMFTWLSSVLSRQYDFECVESAAELAGPDQAVTRAGQVKRSRTRHEKDDRSRVDDRSQWLLGFDNADKVEHLVSLVRRARADQAEAESRLDRAQAAQDAEQQRVRALEFLDQRDWDQLDVESAVERTAAQRDQLAELRVTRKDLQAAEAAAEAAANRLEAARKSQQARLRKHAAAAAVLDGIARVIEQLSATVDARIPVPGPLAEALEQRFLAVRRSISHQVIDDVALSVANRLTAEEKQATALADKARTTFMAVATDFSRRWPAKAGDLSPSIEDRAGYLAMLGQLVADRLPDFESRFFELLERQSQQNVAQLANEIRRAPGEVRERIAPVNTSLGRSAFDAGRFLKIVVKENRGELGRQFLADLQTISAGSWMVQERDAAEAKFEVMRRLMERLASSEAADASWRRHCLDTRLHVRFTATEVDGEGRTVNVHDSSAGLSGGQRQKLVTFCLAAALRYQLAGEDEDIPRYGTVIMDEAFDKADSRFTRMAMDIFQEFGFHMVLATPLKLLQTLEDYIGGMAVVTCKDFRDSQVGSVEIADSSGDIASGPDEPTDLKVEPDAAEVALF
ncbi:ATP-binding protein [Arthrobacter sp. Marseille-P9274]|uniref:ATP-binding protein n=1 Tax=Arthrobacter sp. Marseille-P9274 TaxID=2866572 RepID=UPI0021C5AFCF|nr:SbcC/MukB-like Walker B domain-containing protein [Arthrobacter sp. Marseille-P9274]